MLRRLYQSVLPLQLRKRAWRVRHDLRRKATSLLIDLRCPVCAGKKVAPFNNPQVNELPFDFHICNDCDFIFVHPVPDLPSYYSEIDMPDYGTGIWNQAYLEAISKYAPDKGRLLEIGFGNASFLKLVHDEGWEAHGIDPNQHWVRHATEVVGLRNITCGMIEQTTYPAGFFDVVAAFNLIEHVGNPADVIKEFAGLTRPGGLVVLLCPNISGIYHVLMPEIFRDPPLNMTWIPPDHVGYFNKRNLKLLMETAGLTVIGDESHRTSSLWLQHETALGPGFTDAKLTDLLTDILTSRQQSSDQAMKLYRERIYNLLRERMTWTMILDFMKLEPALGAENAILFVARKPEGQNGT